MKKKMIKKCECGSTDFWLDESIGWKCYLDKDGYLQCKISINETNSIVCEKCGKEYNYEDFKEINFD